MKCKLIALYFRYSYFSNFNVRQVEVMHHQFTSDYKDITTTVKETAIVCNCIYVRLNGDGNAVSLHNCY